MCFAKPAKQFSQDRTYMVLTDQFKTAAQRGAMSGNSNVFIMFIMFPTDDCFSQNISKRRPFEEFLCGSHRRAWPSQGQGCGHQHSTSTAFKVKIEKIFIASKYLKVQHSFLSADQQCNWGAFYRDVMVRLTNDKSKQKGGGARASDKEWPVKA